MIGNLVGKHDSIHTITYRTDSAGTGIFKVVFNRDVSYYINEDFTIVDMEGLHDINEEDFELMRKVISDKIH